MRFPFSTAMLGIETDWISFPADQADATQDFAPVAPVNPTEFLSTFESVGAEVIDVGPETIRGIATTHDQVVFDVEQLLEQADPDELAELEAMGPLPVGEFPIDVWISDDGLIRRFVVLWDGTQIDAPPGEGFERMANAIRHVRLWRLHRHRTSARRPGRRRQRVHGQVERLTFGPSAITKAEGSTSMTAMSRVSPIGTFADRGALSGENDVGEPSEVNGIKTAVLPTVLALVIAACTSGDTATDPEPAPTTAPPAPGTTTTTSTTTPTTTTTTLPPTTLPPTTLGLRAADAALIEELWKGYSESWSGGVSAAYAFMAENSHPVFECTAEDFAEFFNLPEGYSQQVTVDTTNMFRNDEFVIPAGTGEGTMIDGRVYVLLAAFTNEQPGAETEVVERPIRTVIADERAYSLMFCRL